MFQGSTFWHILGTGTHFGTLEHTNTAKTLWYYYLGIIIPHHFKYLHHYCHLFNANCKMLSITIVDIVR